MVLINADASLARVQLLGFPYARVIKSEKVGLIFNVCVGIALSESRRDDSIYLQILAHLDKYKAAFFDEYVYDKCAENWDEHCQECYHEQHFPPENILRAVFQCEKHSINKIRLAAL